MPADRSRILEFWRAVELFSPQNLPKIDPNHEKLPVFDSQADPQLLPWQPSHPLQRREIQETMSWAHTVYAGTFDLGAMRDLVEGVIGRSTEAFDEFPPGKSCLFAFSVTDCGRPIGGSFLLASAGWSVGRTLEVGPESPGWLSGFETCANDLAEIFDQRTQVSRRDRELLVPKRENGQWVQKLETVSGQAGSRLDRSKIIELIKWIGETLGVCQLFSSEEWRVQSRVVSNRRYFEEAENDFLNSFFHQDLANLAAMAKDERLGPSLEGYLKTEIPTSKRIDLIQNPENLLETLSPQHFPKGRWPIVGGYPLVASQQSAVNEAMRSLAQTPGVFSVNGPPGTGKTTLLRDLIASIIVERADRLASLNQPEDAFRVEARWKSGDYTRVISAWREDLVGSEIVIASNNNGAVENISLEIPARDAADPDFVNGEDPFVRFASRLLDREAWALLAAKLGNQTNRKEFIKRFIEPDRSENGDSTSVPGMGFRKFLSKENGKSQDWAKARRRYRHIANNEQRLRHQRIGWAQEYSRLLECASEVTTLETSLAALENRNRVENSGLSELVTALQQADQKRKRLVQYRAEHREFRPGLLQILLTWGKDFHKWRLTDQALASDLEVARRRHQQLELELVDLEHQLLTQKGQVDRIRIQLNNKRTELGKLEGSLEEARETLGPCFPDLRVWSRKDADSDRELSAPWADALWNTARTERFIEAIQIHQAFILANADRFRKNLDGLGDILRGQVPKDAPHEATLAAWQSLFFIVPTISTTFASIPRLLQHLGQGDIGWLLIDEAGQAPPQTAAGAIWRSKRAVVVGDPLQLEPIVPLSLRLQNRFLEYFGVADTWLPSHTSVQSLSDRINLRGTYLKTDSDPVWIGSPLRVHRRCDQPMFSISNEIAYDGLMVHSTSNRAELDFPESCWCHVSSTEAQGHWIPEEGREVLRLLQRLRETPGWESPKDGQNSREVFLLSPFRDVVAGLRQDVVPKLRNLPDLRLVAGTIHTAQGKEADIVILVLGGNPGKDGAKAWASKKPNLLNVAVSRARRRLYVIGDQDRWKPYSYFDVLARYVARPGPSLGQVLN